MKTNDIENIIRISVQYFIPSNPDFLIKSIFVTPEEYDKVAKLKIELEDAKIFITPENHEKSENVNKDLNKDLSAEEKFKLEEEFETFFKKQLITKLKKDYEKKDSVDENNQNK